jgi:hypothetical protein
MGCVSSTTSTTTTQKEAVLLPPVFNTVDVSLFSVPSSTAISSVVGVLKDPPPEKPIQSFDGVHIPLISFDEPWMQYSTYVTVPLTTDALVLEYLEKALRASKRFEVILRRCFSKYNCEFEVHYNSYGVHSDIRYKIYACGGRYVIQMEYRKGDRMMDLFDDVCDYLLDNDIEVKDKSGSAYEKSEIRNQRRRPLRFAAISDTEFDFGTRKRDILDQSIKSNLDIINSRYYDVSIQGLISLVGVIKSSEKENMDLFLEHNIFRILTDKLYSRDEDIKLCAMTAMHALCDIGGRIVHEAIIQQGTFFCLTDACKPTYFEKCAKTPFSDVPFFHGRLDRKFAEANIGAMHPGAFMMFIDKNAVHSNNVATIICLESLQSDGFSLTLEKVFSYEEVIYNSKTKTYRLVSLSPNKVFSSMTELLNQYGAKWTTPLMTSTILLLIRREAVKALAKICETKSAVDMMSQFKVLNCLREAYDDEESDSVVRKAAWEALCNVEKH